MEATVDEITEEQEYIKQDIEESEKRLAHKQFVLEREYEELSRLKMLLASITPPFKKGDGVCHFAAHNGHLAEGIVRGCAKVDDEWLVLVDFPDADVTRGQPRFYSFLASELRKAA